MIKGLFDVYNLGTASTLRVEGIDIAGKTGTAENFAKLEERVQLKDHSIFVAFAPKDNPYFSGKWWLWSNHAGPIASLMIEKYLKEKYKNRLRNKDSKN
jgi:penicillin-binding protein 2